MTVRIRRGRGEKQEIVEKKDAEEMETENYKKWGKGQNSYPWTLIN
jgi:hypothetical protein